MTNPVTVGNIRYYVYSDHVKLGKDEYKINGEPTAAISRTALQGHLVIEESFRGLPITELAENAFFRCILVTNLTIKANIKVIPRGCFGDCYNLNHINIPASVETIDIRGLMFFNISGLYYDTVGSCTVIFRKGSKLRSLGQEAFAYKSQVILFFETPVSCILGKDAFKSVQELLIYSVYPMKLGNYPVIYRHCSCMRNVYIGYLFSIMNLGFINLFL